MASLNVHFVSVSVATLRWLELLPQIASGPSVRPRGIEVRERLNTGYTVPMTAWIDLDARRVNLPFMLAEAAWILRGSNRLDEITPYLKGYARYSDDGVFMRGAYGPKIMDQLPWIVDQLVQDRDTRQAMLTIWRERPAPSKDIPCTVAMQFLIRGDQLHSVVTMRSQDVVLGLTYDVFTFSMVAEAVRRLYTQRVAPVELGQLHVNVGSLHLYATDVDKALAWVRPPALADPRIGETVKRVLALGPLFEDLVSGLELVASGLDR